MNQPNPAIVAQSAVRRLPRTALLLFCLAYVLPGFVWRSPWRNDDVAAYGYMWAMASHQTDWMAPRLLGIAPDVEGLLPYWLGAWAVQAAPSWLAPAFAARLPFIALLVLTLAAVWQGIYYLARSPLAQPVAFAFGGEARPTDYARALADGGLLAFIACLGLAQLSHETTPALTQLCFSALAFYAVAAMPYRRLGPSLAGLVALLGLTFSGAPALAVLFGLGSTAIHLLDRSHAQAEEAAPRRWDRRWAVGMVLLSLLCAGLADWLDLWRWRIELPTASWAVWHGLASLLLWFTWPAWPLVLWTLWRWRRHWLSTQVRRHLALPLWFAGVTVAATLLTKAGDRALLLALPSLATLAAFALPTLERSVSALIDWFTLLFFTGCAFIIWVVWIAMQTGFPPQPAANVARLAPGFVAGFTALPLLFALLATLAWAWLVRWRVGRHRAALWKSMVLPAGGAALCWLLLTTLWMPLLDHARSYRPLVQRIEALVQPAACLQTFGLTPAQLAGLAVHSKLRIEAASDQASCDWLLVENDAVRQIPEMINPVEWQRLQTLSHPREGEEEVVLYRRRKP